MKMLSTLAIVSSLLTSAALADGGCKPAGCSPDRNCVSGCKPTVKKVDIKETCYNIKQKTICIPPTRFPWESSPCDAMCGKNGCGPDGKCAGSCGAKGNCGPDGKCGAGCGADRGCESGGLLSGLRKALGMSNCPEARCVKSPDKSSRKIGEKCACEWKCDDICPKNTGCRKPGCCNDSAAPKASAPAEQAPEVAPAPPTEKSAARRYPGRIIQTGFRSITDFEID